MQWLVLHAGIPIPPISWADVMVLGAKVAAERSWFMAKKTRLGAGADVDTISKAFGADFPVFLGRQDAAAPDAAVAFPESSSPLQVRVCSLWKLSSCCITPSERMHMQWIERRLHSCMCRTS